ncbi:MAG: isopentenyl-diphosphate delta-isomerase, partial [Deltaproteobacteria bacterium]
MKRTTIGNLESLLHDIDGRGYGAYRRIAGRWAGEGFSLFIDHVQGDPFAQPSRLRIRIDTRRHGIPQELWNTGVRRMAAADKLLRIFARACGEETARIRTGSGRSGQVLVDAGGAEVLARSGCEIGPEGLELRFRVGLPARGRTVLGRQAAELLCGALARAARSVSWENIDHEEFRRFVELVEDHDHIQQVLADRGLVAFVRDGSILPRSSGVSSRPLTGAVPFESPPELRVTLTTLHHGEVKGMGIPRGITLITGGGFHGKTTLLEAIQSGVYPHVPG